MISKFIGLFVVVIIALIIVSLIPLGLIWSMNTLFNLGIEFSFINWLAMTVLCVSVKSMLNTTADKSSVLK